MEDPDPIASGRSPDPIASGRSPDPIASGRSPDPIASGRSPDLDAAERDVEDIERALERLDDGTYGTCETCGAPIDEAALAASPTARACAAHARG